MKKTKKIKINLNGKTLFLGKDTSLFKVIKKTKFNLKKAEDRAHILLGLSISVENLDKIIKIIRSSKNPEIAKELILKTKWKVNKSQKIIYLIEDKKNKNVYSFSELQVNAILELRLQKLTALGINEIEQEIKKLTDEIKRYKKKFNLIDESYNANPLSVKNAINKFCQIKKLKFMK